jgi:N-acetylmuramoyl-L-alanine amidase
MENASLQLEGRTVEEEEAAGVLHDMAKTEYINDSSQVAGLMSQELSRREHLFDRGAKQAAFYVLRGTYAPAVLVEMGFVTNNKDAANLQSKKFRKRLIDGIYAGILDFGKVKGWDLRTPR